MRFLPFLSSAIISVPIAIGQDLFSDDSSNVLADLFTSQELPMDSNWIDGSDDLFDGLDTSDLFSTDTLDFSNLEASCTTTTDGQSLNKLRSRDGPVCSPPNDSESESQRQKPDDDFLKDPYYELKKFYRLPLEEDIPPGYAWIRTKPPESLCRSNFPHHLFCLEEYGLGTPEMNSVPGNGQIMPGNYLQCRYGT